MGLFGLFCCLFHFASVNPVCILDNAYLFGCDFADDTDSKARAWEWLTEYEIVRLSKLQSDLAYLVLEEVSEWLHDILEIDVLRETSYVVV